MDWAALQKSASKPREVVLIGPKQDSRRPFALIQVAESDGVDFRIGTFAGGADSGRRVRPVKWRMPEDGKKCLIDFEGRRWECWMGGLPPPVKEGPPSRDDPGGVVVAPPPSPPPGGPPNPPGSPGPGPGSDPGPEAPPPGGDPPARAPDPPSAPPPPGPGNPPEGGQPPPAPPPDDPPKQPPAPEPPPLPPGGGPPPEPEPPPEKKPWKPPPEASETESKTDQQETEEPSSSSQSLSFIVPSMSSLVSQPQFSASLAMVWFGDWSLPGAFSVDGTLKNGPTCCVSGDLATVSIDDSAGAAITFGVGNFEFSLLAFQDLKGTANSTVNICVDGTPNFDEPALIGVDINWHLAFVARSSLIEGNLGLVRIRSGLEVSANYSSITVGSGITDSAVFSIDRDVQALGGTTGTFVSLDFTLIGLQVKSVFDAAFYGWGRGPSRMNAISLGVGLSF